MRARGFIRARSIIGARSGSARAGETRPRTPTHRPARSCFCLLSTPSPARHNTLSANYSLLLVNHLPVPQLLVALDEGLCAFRHRRRATQLPRLHPAHPVHPRSPLPSSALLQSSSPLREPLLPPSSVSSSPSASSALKHSTPPTRTKLLVLSTHNHLRACVHVTRATRLPGPSLPLRAPTKHAPPLSRASCPSMFPSSFLSLPPVLWSSA
jgi:hypothetical protein